MWGSMCVAASSACHSTLFCLLAAWAMLAVRCGYQWIYLHVAGTVSVCYRCLQDCLATASAKWPTAGLTMEVTRTCTWHVSPIDVRLAAGMGCPLPLERYMSDMEHQCSLYHPATQPCSIFLSHRTGTAITRAQRAPQPVVLILPPMPCWSARP